MNVNRLRSNILLLSTAAIWGFAFVAQRVGIKYLGSFSFNGIRFALGSLSLLPLILFFGRKNNTSRETMINKSSSLLPGIIAGTILFTAASLQQVGLYETDAGKAAFITGLYIVLVPILGILLKHRTTVNTWLGVVVAAAGLYLLSVTDGMSIAKGDLLEIIGAFFWAAHILVIDHYTKSVNALKLSFVQFATCSILSMAVALVFETITLKGIMLALIPILYGGLCSVGIAYTLQVVGQKHAHPAHAAIILSLETVFASIGGILLLGERMSLRGYTGCLLMLVGMLLAQLKFGGGKVLKKMIVKERSDS